MNTKKIASLLLAFLMFAGSFTAAFSTEVLADETTGAETTAPEEGETPEDDKNIDYTAVEYKTAEEKLAKMVLRVENDNFQLYSFAKTGEIALRDKRTGQVLFSNPYDVAVTKSSTDTKEELLSQIIINFDKGDGKAMEYHSYVEAALRDQIVVKNIKNGLRVEYAMGRTETRKLVPRMITKERFETMILAKLKENVPASKYDFIYNKFMAFFLLKDPSDPIYTDSTRNDLYLQFPITKKYAVYVIGTDTKDREFNELEEYIKTYCPDYTYEELDYDHELTEYTVTNVAPPLFRMAIEYKLEETGLSATLAANSISFDESTYKLSSVTILPYFGAGNYADHGGYTLIPDGSGTLTTFEDMKNAGTAVNIKSKVYGQDFAYHTNEPKHRQTIRLPIYGLVENYSLTTMGKENRPFVYYYTESGDRIYKNEKLEFYFNDFGELDDSKTSIGQVNQGLYNANGELVWLTPGVTSINFYDANGDVLESVGDDGIFYHDMLNSDGKPTGVLVKATTKLPEDGKYYDSEKNIVGTKMPVESIKYYNEAGEFVSDIEPDDMIYRNGYGVAGEEVTSGEVFVENTVKEDKGFFAIITEGDSLADIMTTSGGAEHSYASLFTSFYPRPTDKYNLADATSVGSNMMWSVTSKRKYTGNYTIKYFMLTDEDKAKEYIDYLATDPVLPEADAETTDAVTGDVTTSPETAAPAEEVNNGKFAPLTIDKDFAETYYKANYMGMVEACRDYFTSTGALTRFTSEEIKEDIPLCIETMGVIDSTERILSIPVNVKVPLTSFEDIQQMNEELKEKGITNVNFKLTGYANGGMTSTVPYGLKWEKKAGGKDGFKALMEYANANGVGIYPEFDFSYVGKVDDFDGFSYKKHAVKTMDNRYISKREYDPAYQTFANTFYDPISPSVFEYFYNKFSPKLLEYKPTGISSGTLGSDLNSDFDKEDPYNREDSKKLVTELLAKMQKDFGNVMVSGGNSYVLPYVNYMLEIPLDSSQFLRSSNSIPFYGMVLHGSVNFTGNALNMAGDIDYELLKAIENGASMYFIFSYQNTDKLKENILYQKYYSVEYKTWAEKELAERYNYLNTAIADVQDKLIIDHEFITGTRVLTPEEIAQLEADKLKQEEEKKENETTTPDADAPDADAPDADVPETEVPDVDEPETEAPDEETEEIDLDNLVDNGKIVKVTYEGGKVFVLNYNNYKVEVDGQEIDALGFITYQQEEGGQN